MICPQTQKGCQHPRACGITGCAESIEIIECSRISGLLPSNYQNNNAGILQMREEFEKLFRVPDGVIFENGQYYSVVSGDDFKYAKNHELAKLTRYAWESFQIRKAKTQSGYTVSIHPETWEKLREMNGDAWECEGHRELVVDTMLNYAYPHFLERANSCLF